MNYEIYSIPPFDKQLKRLVAKYPSLKSEFIELVQRLRVDPLFGTPVGKNCYKIRLAIASKGKGKRGGARIIVNVVITSKKAYLLAIYDKSEKLDLTADELKLLLKNISS